MRSSFAAVIVTSSWALLGCRQSGLPAPTAVEPRATAVASNAAPPARRKPAAASSAKAGVPEPPPLPIPPAPSGTDPEKALFAASLCAASYLDKSVGCRSHPPFERPEQQPDGRFVEHTGDPLLFCAIQRIFHGSFSAPGKKQAVVSFSQCKESEEATWDAGFPGSAVLAEEVDGRWRAIGYEPDVNLGACLQDHRADGRDVLLCRSGLAAPPSGQVLYVFLLDFARSARGKQNAGSLAKLFSDYPGCMNADEGLPSGLSSVEIADMKLQDLNHDGTDDLVVKVKRSHLPPAPALDAKLRAACQRRPNALDARSLLPRPAPKTLEFLSDGERFTPSAATEKLLGQWSKESPEGFNGMEAVGPPMLD